MQAYQVFSRPLDWHQITLLLNLAITNYRCRGLINLPIICNDIINFRPRSLYGNGNGTNLLLQHSVNEWTTILKQIRYKKDTIFWFHVTGSGMERLFIKEYIPKGLVPERLFLLNS